MKLIIFLITLVLLIGLPISTTQKITWVRKARVIKTLRKIALEVGIDSKHLVGICGAETVWVRTETGNRHRTEKAHGLCQVKTSTARDMGFKGKVRELYKVKVNARLAAKYLLWLRDRFKDWNISEAKKWDLVYVSYYAGVNWVKDNTQEALKKPYIFHVKNCYQIKTCRREG